MKAPLRYGITTLAATVGAGTFATGVAATAAAGPDNGFAKREDNAKEWVISDSDNDDDDDTRSRFSNGTQHSRESSGRSRDRTGSRHSAVSRDRDRSRGDQEPRLHQGWSWWCHTRLQRHMTNDRSKNDTR